MMTRNFLKYWYVLLVPFLMYVTFLTFSSGKTPEKKIYNGEPLIFVGGYPRSGTTLMRAILDAHPLVRCGPETVVIPDLLKWNAKHQTNKFWSQNGLDDHLYIDKEFMDDFLREAVFKAIVNNGPMAERLCNKDPFTARYMSVLAQLYPNAKQVFMIRDGRYSVPSWMSVKNITNTKKTLIKRFKEYNDFMTEAETQCEELGENLCFRIHYERLVENPEKILRKLLKFLNLPWNDAVMNHEQFIGTEIGLPKFSTKKPKALKIDEAINTERLEPRWLEEIPPEVMAKMDKIAPIIRHFGYNPYSAIVELSPEIDI